MADFTTINQEIDNNIKQNGVNAITGQKLNTVLKDMMSAVNTEKQDTIDDLDEIRTGAEAGAAAYQMPEEGIPSSDLSEGVQESLENADNAVLYEEQSTKTDQQRNTALANVSNQTANTTTGKMGYKVLDPTKTFAEQVTAENTIYEIRDVFDLNNGSFTIPVGCVLKFNGGVIKNGTLVGVNTKINEKQQIFDNITISGTWIVPNISTDMFKDLSGNNALKNVMALSNPNITNHININNHGYDYWFLPTSLRDKLISVNNNTFIKLNGTIKTKPNDFSTNFIIEFGEGCFNASVTGGTLIGTFGTTEEQTSEGEWQHGIFVQNNANLQEEYGNIHIDGVTCKNLYGDGISVTNSRNVIVENCVQTLCNRNGISIIGGGNCIVRNCKITNITGTGVDCEPNNNATDINGFNLLIENNYIYNCGCAIDTSTTRSDYNGNVLVQNNYIDCTNYFDYGSNYKSVKVIGNSFHNTVGEGVPGFSIAFGENIIISDNSFYNGVSFDPIKDTELVKISGNYFSYASFNIFNITSTQKVIVDNNVIDLISTSPSSSPANLFFTNNTIGGGAINGTYVNSVFVGNNMTLNLFSLQGYSQKLNTVIENNIIKFTSTSAEYHMRATSAIDGLVFNDNEIFLDAFSRYIIWINGKNVNIKRNVVHSNVDSSDINNCTIFLVVNSDTTKPLNVVFDSNNIIYNAAKRPQREINIDYASVVVIPPSIGISTNGNISNKLGVLFAPYNGYGIHDGSKLKDVGLTATIESQATLKDNGVLVGTDTNIPNRAGTTANRPTLSARFTMFPYLDETLKKQVYYNGSKWVDEKGYTPNISKGTFADAQALVTNSLISTSDAGYEFYATDKHKPIYYGGDGKWYDAGGVEITA